MVCGFCKISSDAPMRHAIVGLLHPPADPEGTMVFCSHTCLVKGIQYAANIPNIPVQAPSVQPLAETRKE